MFDAMIETLKANPRKIVFTEGHDARILEATARLVEGGFLTPILIGNVDEVKANAAKGGFNIEGVEIIDPKTSETMDFDAQPGFCILGGVVNDAFGDGEDKITLMVLADSGELLILSGYNLARDHHALYLFLTELLENASMDGAAVYVGEEDAEDTNSENP